MRTRNEDIFKPFTKLLQYHKSSIGEKTMNHNSCLIFFKFNRTSKNVLSRNTNTYEEIGSWNLPQNIQSLCRTALLLVHCRLFSHHFSLIWAAKKIINALKEKNWDLNNI
jgi:hypothetical protein